jgi:hypothetical protein
VEKLRETFQNDNRCPRHVAQALPCALPTPHHHQLRRRCAPPPRPPPCRRPCSTGSTHAASTATTAPTSPDHFPFKFHVSVPTFHFRTGLLNLLLFHPTLPSSMLLALAHNTPPHAPCQLSILACLSHRAEHHRISPPRHTPPVMARFSNTGL